MDLTMLGLRWPGLHIFIFTLTLDVIWKGFYCNAYDYINGEYIHDHDPSVWDSMDVRSIMQHRCVPIPETLTLCRDVGYRNMSLPNLLGHDTVEEVRKQAKPWVPLNNIRCHPNTDLFLCSLYAPVCLDRPIYPCESLCRSVQQSCEVKMNKYGFQWPEILRCDKFPKDDSLCIRQLNVSDTTAANVCLACKQPLTFESLLDSYCWATFVLKVKIRRTVVDKQDMKLLLKGKKKFYKPTPNTMTKTELKKLELFLTDGASCDCDVATKKSGRVLIMGSKRGDRFVVTYISEWSKEREFRRAIKAIRKGHDCKKEIEEIAGQTDANNGGLQVDGKPIPPVQVPTDTNATKEKKGKGNKRGNGKKKNRDKKNKKNNKKDKNDKNDDDKKDKSDAKTDPMENIAGIGCIPCKQPLVYENLVDIYCKASFAAKVKVRKVAIDDNGDKRLVVRRIKPNAIYRQDSNVINPKDIKKLQPVISGGSSCDCASASSKKSVLAMGIKQGGRYVLTYLSEFVKDVELQRFISAIRKNLDCSTAVKST